MIKVIFMGVHDGTAVYGDLIYDPFENGGQCYIAERTKERLSFEVEENTVEIILKNIVEEGEKPSYKVFTTDIEVAADNFVKNFPKYAIDGRYRTGNINIEDDIIVHIIISDEDIYNEVKQTTGNVNYYYAKKKDGEPSYRLVSSIWVDVYDDIKLFMSEAYEEILSSSDNHFYISREQLDNEKRDDPDFFNDDFYTGDGWYNESNILVFEHNEKCVTYGYDNYSYAVIAVIIFDEEE